MSPRTSNRPTKAVWCFIILDRICQIIYRFTPWGGAALVAYVAIYLPIQAGAGQSTQIEYLVKVVGDLKIDRWVAYIMGGAGVIYGFSERKLRRDTTARLTERIQILEKQKDPGRSSSELTPHGDTPPELAS